MEENGKSGGKGREKGRKEEELDKENALFFVSLHMGGDLTQQMCRGNRTT